MNKKSNPVTMIALAASMAFFFGMLIGSVSSACTLWQAQSDVVCTYGDMQDGTLWSRSCPSTVCHRDGRYITNIPCDNETICMPASSLDGPIVPGTSEPLPIQTNPNQLSSVCQKWYPIESDDSQLGGCPDGQTEWTRACQKYDPVNLPTQTCSAGYPGNN